MSAETPPYRLVRSARRKTAAIKVDYNGVEVRVPAHADAEWVRRWVQSKAQWIALQQGKLERQHQQYAIHICQGAALPLGDRVLRLSWMAGPRNQVELCADQIRVYLSVRGKGEEIDRVTALLQQWLKQEALRRFEPRLKFWSQRMGLAYSGFSVKGYRRRWGSCDNRGRISLNWRLVLVPESLLDYVIIHELSHLRHFNHSAAFWALVESYCPQWRTARDCLQQRGALLEF